MMIYLVVIAIFTAEALNFVKLDKHVRPLLEFNGMSKFEMISVQQKHVIVHEAARLYRWLPVEDEEFIVRNKQTKAYFIHPGNGTPWPNTVRDLFQNFFKEIDQNCPLYPLSEWTIAIDRDRHRYEMMVAQHKPTKMTFKKTSGAEKWLEKAVPSDTEVRSEFIPLKMEPRHHDIIYKMLLQNGAKLILEQNEREIDFLKRTRNYLPKTTSYLMKISKDADIKRFEEEEKKRAQLTVAEKIQLDVREENKTKCILCYDKWHVVVKKVELDPCGHKICSACWADYLRRYDGPQLERKCPICRQKITNVLINTGKCFSKCNII